jgi:hypothetical protein
MATEHVTEKVAVLMTPSEKAVFVDRLSSLGLSLGKFFREAEAAYAERCAQRLQRPQVAACWLAQETLVAQHLRAFCQVRRRGDTHGFWCTQSVGCCLSPPT